MQLLQQGSASLPSMSLLSSSSPKDNTTHDDGDNKSSEEEHGDGEDDDDDESGGAVNGNRVRPSSLAVSSRGRKKTGAGAAAKGRAAAALPPGFAAARAGDLEALKKLVEGGDDNSHNNSNKNDVDKWDPKAAMDKNGSSPLDWAAGEGRLEVCRYANWWALAHSPANSLLLLLRKSENERVLVGVGWRIGFDISLCGLDKTRVEVSRVLSWGDELRPGYFL